MTTLAERLNDYLPKVLPESPEKAINGTALIERLRREYMPDANPDTLRAYFSYLAKDPTSPIAKVDQGQGYYLRATSTAVAAPEDAVPSEGTPLEIAGARDKQPEEKFRAFFIRWSQQQEAGVLGVVLDHTKARKLPKGINKWKYPDVLLMKWYDLLDKDAEYTKGIMKLDKTLVGMKRSLGEAPYRVTSVELKADVDANSVREFFFQCVSNSRWAHTAQLAIANKVTDQTVADELRRLGSSYGVKIVTFGLSELESMATADKLRDMDQGAFDTEMNKANVEVISPGIDRDTLDWEHIKDVRRQLNDFGEVFRWTEDCMEKFQLTPFDKWQQHQKADPWASRARYEP